MSIAKAFLLIACCGLLTTGYAGADEAAVKGRAVLAANQDAVITVRIINSFSYGGQENENESEATATIIGSDGLAVLSLYAVDPSSLAQQVREEMEDFVVKVTGLDMILADGREVPAEVVLRDKDLDIAFIRPIEKPSDEMVFVDMAANGKPELLDELVVVTQLGKVARRTHSVFLDRIEAIIEKPRTLYVPGDARGRMILSSPAFMLDGEFVGVGVMRAIRSKGMGGGIGDNVMIIVVPAADIIEASEQVPPFKE